jgi:hypothetical protein
LPTPPRSDHQANRSNAASAAAVHAPIDRSPATVEIAVDRLAAPIEPAIDAVTACIEPLGGEIPAVRFSSTRGAIEAGVDAIAAHIEPVLGAIAALIEPLLDAVALVVGALGRVRGNLQRADQQPQT